VATAWPRESPESPAAAPIRLPRRRPRDFRPRAAGARLRRCGDRPRRGFAPPRAGFHRPWPGLAARQRPAPHIREELPAAPTVAQSAARPALAAVGGRGLPRWVRHPRQAGPAALPSEADRAPGQPEPAPSAAPPSPLPCVPVGCLPGRRLLNGDVRRAWRCVLRGGASPRPDDAYGAPAAPHAAVRERVCASPWRRPVPRAAVPVQPRAAGLPASRLFGPPPFRWAGQAGPGGSPLRAGHPSSPSPWRGAG